MYKQNAVNKNNQKVNNRKPRLVILAAVVTLLIAGGLFLVLNQNNKKTANLTGSKTPNIAPNSVNYNPPTAQEKADSQSHKDDLVKQMNDESNTNQTNTASPVITSVSMNGNQVTVSAYVGGIFEDGGSCTVTATKNGAATVTQTGSAFANATTTDCAPVNIARSSFTMSGDWSFVVSYKSAAASGSSPSKTFTVQ